MKKILSLILSILLITYLFPLSLIAENSSIESLQYKISEGKAIITKCSKDFKGELFIPSKIESYEVTDISDMAFSFCTGITSVIIPKTIINIGKYAFSSCTGLLSANIPDSVLNIQEYAFCNCTNLSSIKISKSVTSIGNYAFRNCTRISSIIVEKDNSVYKDFSNCLINKISKELVLGCSASIIPKDGSVTSIGDWAFNWCTELKSFIIPDNVTEIGSNSFGYCVGLTSISFPEGLKSIGEDAFNNCTGLTSLKIPNSVEYIGDRAFLGCIGLTNITLSNNLKNINKNVFNKCSSLLSLDIPNGVINIEDYAFENCTGLLNITFSKSVNYISNFTFIGCTSLDSIKVEQENKKFHSINNCLIDTENKAIILGCKTSIIPNDNSVTNINDYAFYDCLGLTYINIPDGVKSIGDSVFKNCTGLLNIIIPKSIISIGDSTFSECSSLKIVYYTGNIEDFHKINIQSYENNCFINADIISNYILTVFGDVNHDGACDIKDFTYIKKALSKYVVGEAFNYYYDINRDNKISSLDLVELKKELLK